MSESKLDQVVKGAPPPDAAKIPKPPRTLSSTPSVSISQHDDDVGESDPVPDHVSMLPSAAPQIYLNLLILEASLRSQYVTLRARRRQHTFFLLLLSAWITYFLYALFLRPREDGRGVGGSVYWVVETAEKMALLGGTFTAILVWGTGQWERGIRWPRRWVAVANRGLRSVNAKVVVIKGPWWKEVWSTFTFLFPSPSLFSPCTSTYYYVDRAAGRPKDRGRQPASRLASRERITDDASAATTTTTTTTTTTIEEDLSAGGDLIKLLLLPKPFSPDFRENWELYRAEYWERENERRTSLRRQIRQQRRQVAKQEGGWLWWTGWRGWKKARSIAGRPDTLQGRSHSVQTHQHQHHQHQHHQHQHHQQQQTHHQQHHHQSQSHQSHLSHERIEREQRRRAKASSRSGSFSGTSSRSTTPTRDMDDGVSPRERRRRRRRSSNASSNGGGGNGGGNIGGGTTARLPRRTRQNSLSTTGNIRPKRLTKTRTTTTSSSSGNVGGGGGGGGGGGAAATDGATDTAAAAATSTARPSIIRSEDSYRASTTSGGESD